MRGIGSGLSVCPHRLRARSVGCRAADATGCLDSTRGLWYKRGVAWGDQSRRVSMKHKRRFPPKPESHYSDRLGGTYENGGLHTVWCLWLKQERDTSFGSFDGGFYHLVGTFCE